MVKQFLLNQDGTWPTFIDRPALEAQGIVFVMPVTVPEVFGRTYSEGQPKLEDGIWYQTWVDVPDSEKPPIEVPAAVTMRQARLALLSVGLLGKVGAAIAALPSPAREAAQIEWEYSAEVQREKPFVKTLGGALGLSEAMLDTLFINAAKL